MITFSDEQKIIVAQQLKELRNNKGLSHEKLATELSKQGVQVSVQALKDYEVTDIAHSKFNSTKGMKIETFFGIAQFYDVSTDYLFGLSEVKSIDNDVKIACKVTGLSEKAMSYFISYNEIENECGNIDIINRFMENPHFEDFIAHIYFFEEYLLKSKEGKFEELYDSNEKFKIACDTFDELDYPIYSDELVAKYFLDTASQVAKHIIKNLNTPINTDEEIKAYPFFDWEIDFRNISISQKQLKKEVSDNGKHTPTKE